MLCTYKSREKSILMGTFLLKDRIFALRVPINRAKNLFL